MKWRFELKPFIIFCIIFLIEVLIAKFINDNIIRPYVGDILAVILIYYFIKAFIQTKSIYIIFGTVLFAYLVEIGQYLHIADILGVKNKILRIMIGSSFSWGDIICYTIGGTICYIFNKDKSISQ
ncbi:MAG: DUF2809 domain-containing protein [Prevotella sp.]|jgi:DNA integrity scanning protein DisA with diadenylate cyclase activity|nr:DUF2809 domain-containing protein [Prevotella sp.]